MSTVLTMKNAPLLVSFSIEECRLPQTKADRLAEIGLHRGAAVQVVGRAVLQGPVIVETKGVLLCLRLSDAEKILLK